jgi:metal-dependent hydrolase (beta-lactamase superfamily II)
MVSSRKNPDDHVPGSRNLGALHGASYHCTSPAGTGIPDGGNRSLDEGFSALVEVAGKRILFDTGNDADIFAANVKASGVDLKTLDFVVLSHRHSDQMAGLSYVLSVNPTVKIYAPKEGFAWHLRSSLPSSFYRKDETLPPEMRYYSVAKHANKGFAVVGGVRQCRR